MEMLKVVIVIDVPCIVEIFIWYDILFLNLLIIQIENKK